MSATDNKQVIRRFYDECWNPANTALIDTFVAPVYRDQYLAAIEAMHAGFPDFRWAIEEMIAEGDKVAMRWTLHGTHRGEYVGIAPTGKPVNWPGATIFQLAEGKIVGRSVHADMHELRQQLGASSA